MVEKRPVLFNGHDISYKNDVTDWKLFSQNTDFVIIHCCSGDEETGKLDMKWEEHIKQAVRYRIPRGAYIYSHANSAEEVSKEADFILKYIKNYEFQYPIYLFIDDDHMRALSNEELGRIAETFGSKIIEAGFLPAIYTNVAWLDVKLTDDRVVDYDKCVAQYVYDNTSYQGSYQMWQYTNKGSTSGLEGEVCDKIHSYVDYKIALDGFRRRYSYREFVKDIQRCYGFIPDGIATDELVKSTLTISSTENRDHSCVKYVQKYLYQLGFRIVGPAFGYADKRFEKSIKKYQEKVGIEITGILDAGGNTWQELLKKKPYWIDYINPPEGYLSSCNQLTNNDLHQEERSKNFKGFVIDDGLPHLE